MINIKKAVAKDTVEMLHKIKTIEKEIMNLKLSVLKKLIPSEKKVTKLKGIIKGLDITKKILLL